MTILFNKSLSQHIFHSVTLGGNPFGLTVYRYKFWNPTMMSHKLLHPWWALSAAVVWYLGGGSYTLPSQTYQGNEVFQNEQSARRIRHHHNTYTELYFCHARTKKSISMRWCKILWDNIRTIILLSFDAFLGMFTAKNLFNCSHQTRPFIICTLH
jgi:hypothetical protein